MDEALDELVVVAGNVASADDPAPLCDGGRECETEREWLWPGEDAWMGVGDRSCFGGMADMEAE